MIGQVLGHYKIMEKLGEGGMGAVYKARDTHLDRFAAIKVLRPDKVADSERKQRFIQEAKSASALNHPNILTIYDISSDQNMDFMAMEYVEGKTLAELIPRKGLRLGDVLKYAVQIADALSAAHDAGIIHRDVKPSNIMVNDQSRVKVLDFGLVKLKEQTPPIGLEELPTLSVRTDEGKIVGTVHYMSPEQAEGKRVDHRSDIFSLGIVLYEMATGERPFKGDSNLSVLSSIVRDTPKQAREINPEVSKDLSRIIRRCLNKDPDYRYQNAKDLRNDLVELKQDHDSGEYTQQPVVEHRSMRRIYFASSAVLIVVALIVASFWFFNRGRQVPTGGTAIISAEFRQITFQRGVESFPSISPDGKWVVYQSDAAGNADIYLQNLSEQTAINLTRDTPEADTQPAFSPDGQSIAFRSGRDGGGIFQMGITGGNVRRISESGFDPAWSPSGREIIYGTVSTNINPYDRGGKGELWVADVITGQKRRLFEGDALQPRWSPHGKRIAFWGLIAGGSQRDLWTIAAEGGKPVPVTDDDALDWSPAWSPDGEYLYFASDRGGALGLWRVHINEENGHVLGAPQSLNTPSNWIGQMNFSSDGRHLVFFSFTGSRNIQRFSFDPAKATVSDSGSWVTKRSQFAGTTFIDLSPDDQWLVYNTGQTQDDIFICRTDGSELRALTNDRARDRGPRWSPSGDQIAFYSDRSGRYEIWTIHSDGSGLKQMSEGQLFRCQGPRWSPNGSRMFVVDFTARSTAIFDLTTAWKNQTPEILPPPPEPDSFFMARLWSSNGAKLAGISGRGIAEYDIASKKYEFFTRDGGSWPEAWLNGSRKLLYVRQGKLMILDTESKKSQEVLSVLPEVISLFTVSRDNRTLYVVRSSYESDIWLATLK
jgi:serine/threonine protein kinase/sugar lactone lactonase YvrE